MRNRAYSRDTESCWAGEARYAKCCGAVLYMRVLCFGEDHEYYRRCCGFSFGSVTEKSRLADSVWVHVAG